MAKITLNLNYLTFLAMLTSFNFGWGVLRWVAWTIWSDACLLDQITYVILIKTAANKGDQNGSWLWFKIKFFFKNCPKPKVCPILFSPSQHQTEEKKSLILVNIPVSWHKNSRTKMGKATLLLSRMGKNSNSRLRKKQPLKSFCHWLPSR